MTLRKFASQPQSVRKRHAPRLLQEQERRYLAGMSVNRSFLRSFVRMLRQESWLRDSDRVALDAVVRELDALRNAQAGEIAAEKSGDELVRALNTARHALLDASGRQFADWDAAPGHEEDRPAADSSNADPQLQRQRFNIALFGECIRSPFNVGSLIRCAEAFGAKECYFTHDSASVEHPRARRSAMGSERDIDVIRCDIDSLQRLGVPLFAVETGGVSIAEFSFPGYGVALLGNEELGLSQETMEIARNRSGVVSIPLYGRKGSLNVAAAAAVVLSWWTSRIRAEL